MWLKYTDKSCKKHIIKVQLGIKKLPMHILAYTCYAHQMVIVFLLFPC